MTGEMTERRPMFCMDDPHETEARLAADEPPTADEDMTASELAGYFVTFQQRMDEYRHDCQRELRLENPLECRSALERIIPSDTDASFAGFEAYLPPTIAAAIYTWLSVLAYRDGAHHGLLRRFSYEWHVRKLVAESLAKNAARTLNVLGGSRGLDIFAKCFEQSTNGNDRPRLRRILAMHTKAEALSAWRDEWDALEVSYDDGDIDYDDYTLGKDELLARHP